MFALFLQQSVSLYLYAVQEFLDRLSSKNGLIVVGLKELVDLTVGNRLEELFLQLL